MRWSVLVSGGGVVSNCRCAAVERFLTAPIVPLSPGRQSGHERSLKCHIRPIIMLNIDLDTDLDTDLNIDLSIRRTGTQKKTVAPDRR